MVSWLVKYLVLHYTKSINIKPYICLIVNDINDEQIRPIPRVININWTCNQLKTMQFYLLSKVVSTEFKTLIGIVFWIMPFFLNLATRGMFQPLHKVKRIPTAKENKHVFEKHFILYGKESWFDQENCFFCYWPSSLT